MQIAIYEFGHVHCCKLGSRYEIENIVVNSVDPDETARYEPSHQDLLCLKW